MVADLAAAVSDQIDTFFGSCDPFAGKSTLPAAGQQAETTLLAPAAAGSEAGDYPLLALDKKNQEWWS